jgi:Transposase IS116/IS110/IS902 family
MWLAAQPLHDDERTTVNSWLAELDWLAVDLGQVDAALARVGLGDDRVRRLMTITGINVTVAVGLASAIGDITRFDSSEKLVSCFGLNPRVRQSGMDALTTAVSPRLDDRWCVAFWSRRLGVLRLRPDLFAPFSCASKYGADSRSPSSRPHARWRFSSGSSSRKSEDYGVWTASAPSSQAAKNRDQGRTAVEAGRQHSGASKGLQHQNPPRR